MKKIKTYQNQKHLQTINSILYDLHVEDRKHSGNRRKCWLPLSMSFPHNIFKTPFGRIKATMIYQADRQHLKI